MIDLDSLLKNSFVISISQDKFRTFSTIFRKRGLPGVRLFRGFDDADMTGKKKCGISHAAIVKMAQSLDLPYVCVFEDDAYPRIDAAEMLADELRRVDDGTDVLILGWCNNIQTSGDFELAGQCNGSHAYVVFRHGYESFQKCYSATCTKHFDRVFYKMAGAGSVVRCSKNNLFIQYSAGVSMNKHTGYIYSGNDNAFPPAGFSTVQKIMFRKPADKSGVLGALGDLVRRCESSLDGRPRDRCVVIGQDAGRLNSVVAGKYVDIYGITKIRVNQLARKRFRENYGRRTDLFVCTEEYRAELASAKKKHAVIDELTMRRLSAELFGSDAVMVSPCFAVAATACAMFKRVEVLGVSLTDDELSILNAVFGNIDRIESVHPELTRSGHGVFNGFYRDKTVVPDVLRKLGITRVQDILSINRHAKISNKCIIVGGSESVKTGSFGEYVDSCDRTVIRINTVFAPDGYERFVGRRTDLVIASSYHLGHDVINKDGRDKDISVYLTNEIRQKMKSGKSPLTTGFMAFLLCLYVFDDIELLGFGQSGDISPAGTCESYHNAGNKTQTGCRHDINFEHRFIDKLVADPEFNVSRVEESHAELLFQSSK